MSIHILKIQKKNGHEASLGEYKNLLCEKFWNFDFLAIFWARKSEKIRKIQFFENFGPKKVFLVIANIV